MMSTTSATRVLVTGASGFVATHVCKQLLEAGYKVRGTVRSVANESKIKPLRQLCPQAATNLELVEADLLKEESWLKAVNDCQYVIHTASPVPEAEPPNPDDVIKPALDGTLNVLKACRSAKCVKRLVLTSSIVAIGCGEGDINKVLTEKDWTNIEHKSITSYDKSKVLAERAAWDFVRQLQPSETFELAVINPGYIIGPVIHDTPGFSALVIKRLLEHSIPMVPRISLSCADVRDVAAAHIKAMTVPEAAGTRNIVVNKNLWFLDMAEILKKEFQSQGYSVPTRVAPYAVMWLFSFIDKAARTALARFDKDVKFDNTASKQRLGIEYHDIQKTAVEMAYTLIDRGVVKRTSKYRSRAVPAE